MISVVICAHNPNLGTLGRVLSALQAQTLPASQWELVLVDNASAVPLVDVVSLDWPARTFHVREEAPGLTCARRAGVAASCGDLVVFVDDDNVLCADYLELAAAASREYPRVGMFGGAVEAEWLGQIEKPAWLMEAQDALAIRDFGDRLQIHMPGGPLEYPAFAPVGAGMVIRRAALQPWLTSLEGGDGLISDRKGADLTSGGDNDIVLFALRNGWGAAYLPDLRLTHLLPPGRAAFDYHLRLAYAIQRSWTKVLWKHGICPWPPVHPSTVSMRKLKAYLQQGPWRGAREQLAYQRACGQFDGLAECHRMERRLERGAR